MAIKRNLECLECGKEVVAKMEKWPYSDTIYCPDCDRVMTTIRHSGDEGK